jgi:hypothetical protein
VEWQFEQAEVRKAILVETLLDVLIMFGRWMEHPSILKWNSIFFSRSVVRERAQSGIPDSLCRKIRKDAGSISSREREKTQLHKSKRFTSRTCHSKE